MVYHRMCSFAFYVIISSNPKIYLESLTGIYSVLLLRYFMNILYYCLVFVLFAVW
jgi:hypothetical protein